MKKSHTTSLLKLSELCFDSDISEFNNVLNKPELLLQNCSYTDRNILSSLKILVPGIFSITKLKSGGNRSCARRSVRALLKACHNIFCRFHAFYDKCNRKESPFIFRDRWSSFYPQELQDLMNERYAVPRKFSKLLRGNEYQLALRTGAYFPSRPQLRPLPFNDEECINSDFESAATCSKDFLQRHKTFTPGALTFSCSCAHPNIVGFKVL